MNRGDKHTHSQKKEDKIYYHCFMTKKFFAFKKNDEFGHFF